MPERIGPHRLQHGGDWSEHLSAEAGLVESRTDAQFRVYRVRRETLGPVAAMLEAMWTDALWHLKLKAELKESRRGPQPRRRRRSPTKGQKR